LYVGGGLVVLLILFSIVKGLLGGGSNLTPFISIAQDQQELIHLTTNATQQQSQGQSMTTIDQNFAITSQLSITSAQAAIIKYMATNGKKVNTKTLSLRINTATDTQLTGSAAAGNYDQTFQAIMKDKLVAYSNGLKQAYKQTSGPKGRTLLADDYRQAQLLLVQLNQPAQ
jgi:hypothetical protein